MKKKIKKKQSFNKVFKRVGFNKIGNILLTIIVCYIARLSLVFYNTVMEMEDMYGDVYDNKVDIDYRTIKIDKLLQEKNIGE